MLLPVIIATAALASNPPIWTSPPTIQYGAGEGAGYLTPDRLTVHQKEEMSYIFTVGEGGMKVGDMLRLEDPLFHGIRVSKWAQLSTDPTACTPLAEGDMSVALVSAATEASATLSIVRSTDSIDIHDYATTDITVETGILPPDSQIVVTFGDSSSYPDCGFQTPPRIFHQVYWRAWEWRTELDEFVTVEPHASYSVLHRLEATSMLAVTPSTAQVGDTVRLKVAMLDEFGNPVEDYEGQVMVETAYGGESYQLTAVDGGWHDFSIALDSEEIARVEVSADGLEATSNPIKVTSDPPVWNAYWGDIHTHHGHSVELEDGSLFDENIYYARDIVGLDVSSESMKATPIELASDAVFKELVDNCYEHTVNKQFLSLLGFEWTHVNHGHHNVYYDSCEGQLGTMSIDSLAEENGLWSWLSQQRDQTGVDAVTIPHASQYTGYDWFRSNRVNPEFDHEWRRAIEVYSAWGNSMVPEDEPGSVPVGLAQGVKAGFISSSDNHLGWMGNGLSSEKSALPGLAAFVSLDLTRAGIFSALRDRRTYATTGPRILVDFCLAEDGVTVQQGQDHLGKSPVFHWELHGTQPISRVRLVGVEIATDGTPFTIHEEYPDALDSSGVYEFSGSDWERSAMAVWLEIEQSDGNMAWGSPLYLEHSGCGCQTSDRFAGVLFLAPLLIVLIRRRSSAC